MLENAIFIMYRFAPLLIFIIVLNVAFSQNFFIMEYFPKKVYSDTDFNLTLVFKNLGIEFARDLTLYVFSNYFISWNSKYYITKKVPEAEESGKYFGTIIQYENISVKIPLRSRDLPKGIYPLNLKLVYKNPEGRILMENFTIFIEIIPKPSISMKVDIVPEKIEYDKDFMLKILLINDGKDKVKNCSIKIGSDLEGPVKYYVGDILPGNVTIINLPYKANATGIHTISMGLYCNNYETFKTIPIFIFSRKPPDVKISSLDISPEIPLSGKTFTLTIVLENYGDIEAKSVRVYAKAPEGFKFREEYFIGNIAPGDTYTLIIDMVPNVKEGKYTIPINITYFDENGKVYNKLEKIVINVSEMKRKNIFNLVIIVLLLIVAILIYLRFKKK